MSEVGDRIRELREIHEWTLSDLSEQTGISVGMLSHIERGRREGKRETIEAIAQAFSISVGLLQDPDVDVRWLKRASYILREIQNLEEDQLALVEQTISTLKGSR
jgi:transcriptional regulator with XRE-family HTH domain